MNRRICRTPDEILAAGMHVACEHEISPMRDCPECRLSASEIGRLAVLHRPYVAAAAEDAAHAAA
ncbi:hypothetical protein KVH15_33325 [Streptomyces olivaceus]|uniref:hypothetical protein n=1 Tax=Streptomyces olivaceus TaxID=47716 RepID=UPI001CCE941F|nr:hypothetical protein [Streptomyces olivaceus]MBZ6085866.1 hypothetical protein [Streptomyces olivaceus]GHI91688.1 hypothetical protein TPA0905_11590 [Streptomyces olivaceus]